jgi:thioesterase domain-containing protein/acyl carrier protein
MMFVRWAQTVFSPEELAGVLLSTSVCFDLSIFEIFVPLSVGGKVIVVQNALFLPSDEAKQEVTLINTVPSAMAELVNMKAVPRSVKTINLAGEALTEPLVNEIYSSTAAEKVYNLYGPTEYTTYSTYTLTQPNTPVTIGRPLPNTQAYVVDRYGNPQPVGIPGELYLAGEGLARGYYGRPDLTAERFIPNPFSAKSPRMYKTSDLCRWLADGNLQYLGRLDHQVKLRGFRIELGEIEAALAKHPGVRQCVAMAREDEPGMKQLVAYVVATPRERPKAEKLREHLKRSLPEFMVPAAFVMLDSLPLTPNGKVDRKALPKAELQAGALTVPPRDELEGKLQKIWQEILRTEPIGITDNFFDLGGHSLMAVRLVNEIKNLTGMEVPLRSLFQGATIEHLANIVRGTTIISHAVAHQIQPGGNLPPFFAAVLAGVNALGYIPLAKHLGPEQPVYALQSPGPGPHSTGRPYSPQEYEQVAGEYVQAMKGVQPKGPYQIGGTCEGARIAFEMTRILESQGEMVSLLAIIDTWALENTQNRKLWKIYYYSIRLQQIWNMSWKFRFAVVGKAVRNRVRWWLGLKQAPRKSEWIDAYWPGDDFVPARVQGRITVFKIPKQPFYYHGDPLLGWGSRTVCGVDAQVIPSGKHLLLLREPYVCNLAAALSQTLKRLHDKNGRMPQIEEQVGPAEVAAAQ